MKISVLAVFAVAGLLTSGALYLNRPKPLLIEPTPPIEATTTETSQEQQAPKDSPVTQPSSAGRVKAFARATPAVSQPAAPGNSIVDKSMVTQIVDLLLSAQTPYEQKRAAWKQLKEGGKLDQVISSLEQRTAAEPRAAECAAVLGHAYLQKCGTIQDVREQGILAMQADKAFDAALNVDPANWEARYMKAVALSYWPPSMNKGQEVMDHFQTLVQQQETQPSQPQFAETYLRLGEQYQRAGRTDEAQATWERGLQLFPQQQELMRKLGLAQ